VDDTDDGEEDDERAPKSFLKLSFVDLVSSSFFVTIRTPFSDP